MWHKKYQRYKYVSQFLNFSYTVLVGVHFMLFDQEMNLNHYTK